MTLRKQPPCRQYTPSREGINVTTRRNISLWNPFKEVCGIALYTAPYVNMCSKIAFRATIRIRNDKYRISVLFYIFYYHVFLALCAQNVCIKGASLCMYIYMCVCMYVCTYVYIYIYIQGVYKWMVQFHKLTRFLFLTLHGHNVHRQQRQLSKFLTRYQQFASHAYCGAAGPVSKTASQQKKAFCVLRFEVRLL